MRAPLDTGPGWPGIVGFVLTTLAALIIQGAAGRIGVNGALFVNLPLIVLFLWSFKRPGLVSPIALLIAGLLQDLVTGGPLGVWALAYLVAFAAARDREADGAGVEVGPAALRFAALSAAAYVTAWAAGSAAVGAPAGFQALIAEALLTILLFPAFAWVFVRRKERSAFF
ncbi:MAG: rod shape-determining protein MreD [Oceanicaulis sp.]